MFSTTTRRPLGEALLFADEHRHDADETEGEEHVEPVLDGDHVTQVAELRIDRGQQHRA